VSSSFSDLGVPADVVASLARRGITEAFPIQSMAIPPALAGRDVCGRAPTGSGKTLAFGIPLAQRVTRARPARPRALVLAPTRELAAQIHEELHKLLGPQGRSVASFYGGVSFTPQLKVLRRGVDVAVACPGRLGDLVRRGNLILDDVQFVVIDEADRMADMGFLPDVKRILDQVRPDRQTLLFSATLDGDVDVLIKRYQQDPARCEVEVEQAEADRTTHHFLRATREDRVGMTADLVGEHGSAVVFCRTKHGADRVAGQLQRAGVSAVAIHGGRSQSQRDRALAAFSGGRVQALVATDVAARGIHVDNVGCVVHFDVAGDHKDYVHRSGRTGRAGAEGVVVSFVTDADVAKVRQLQKALGVPLHPKAGTPAPGPGPGRTARPPRNRRPQSQPQSRRRTA
jgi:superfamily II DNA/RNA helicase